MSFEKEYYEAPGFWEGGMVDDYANQVRIQTTVDMLPADISTLLDVGCGNGKFLKKIIEQKSNISVTGLDRSTEALKHLNAEKIESDIVSFKVDKKYDCVSCLEVLEHVHHPSFEQALSNLANASNKYLLISVPYKEVLENGYTTCPVCKCTFNRDLHMRSFDDEYFSGLFEKYGFKCIKKINIIKTKEVIGLETYIKLKNLFKKRAKQTEFESPICILCGYKGNYQPANSQVSTVQKSDNKPKNPIKRFVYNLLPKRERDGYWIIGLFAK